MTKYDVIIIGFGKGGKTLAAEFAKQDKKVAVVEKSPLMYGGTCINIGCIPTKTLVHQAKLASEMNMKSFDEKKQFYSDSIGLKDALVETLRNKNYHNLADNSNITVYTGTGSFESPELIRVKNEHEDFLLNSENIVIDTGAETVIPPIDGIIDNPFVYTSTSIMNLKELPRRLIIVGGGYIGLEFASMYTSFGSEVTVLESYPELLLREDRDIAESVKTALEKKGVIFRMNARVESIDNNNKDASVSFIDTDTNELVILQADDILLATGRRPNTKELNTEAAGVAVDDRGAIIVDEYLVTTQPNIRAVGDVKGGLQFTYISLDDYRIIRNDLSGKKSRTTGDRIPVSYSVFIDPPLSHIGLNETEALKQNRKVIVKKLPVAAIPRAKTLGESDGLLKAVIDADTNTILGCTLFAPESSEVINFVALAMKQNLDSTYLRDFIFTHPSMSEALNDLFA
ncbi:MAG: FAD-dependent oxidoreductase [Bacteroidales bacterium]